MDVRPTYAQSLGAAAIGTVLPFVVIMIVGLTETSAQETERFLAVQMWLVLGIAGAFLTPLLIPAWRRNWAFLAIASTGALASIGIAHAEPVGWMFLPALAACGVLLALDWNSPALVATMIIATGGAATALSALSGDLAIVATTLVIMIPTLAAVRIPVGDVARTWTLRILFSAAALYAGFSITASIGASDPSLLLGAFFGAAYALVIAGFLWHQQLARLHVSGGIPTPTNHQVTPAAAPTVE